jgi:OOP family OmpA-OmpF porin
MQDPRFRRHIVPAAVLTLLAAGTAPSAAPAQPVAAPAASAPGHAGPVVVSGVVPDEATRAAILARVRELYGAQRVVDQLGIDKLVTPPQWAQQVQRVLTPELLQVTQGRLRISGNVVEIDGRAESEPLHQRLIDGMVTRLDNPTYTVRDALRVSPPAQQALDAALAQRTIAFEPGNATLTRAGMQVLDELIPLLRQFAGRRFEVVGHTDDRGTRAANLDLSAARAAAVKAYLVGQGIPAADIETSGAGPDRPVADNLSPEGRARNRRIEFRVLA